MKLTKILIALIGLTACNNHSDNKIIVAADKDSKNTYQKIQYSEKELVSLLDSIGNSSPDILSENLTFVVDSTLKNQTKLNYKLSPSDFNILKKTAISGKINLDLAKRILPQFEIDSLLLESLQNNLLPISYYSFDKKQKDFNEFAISIGYDGGLFGKNDVYFFKSDKVIAKHKIFHRYGLELKHFKNEFNETIIYYNVNYRSGTGIWWHQFNFYRYENDELLPTLTEIENTNLQYPWSIRAYWIESTILDTKPLKLKFVFNNQFSDTLGNQIEFINDSTEIKYKFDTEKKIYEPDFGDTKLNRFKLLTYFHADNELLFVNANYDLFKTELNSKDQQKRQAILNYLNDLKNGLERR